MQERNLINASLDFVNISAASYTPDSYSLPWFGFLSPEDDLRLVQNEREWNILLTIFESVLWNVLKRCNATHDHVFIIYKNTEQTKQRRTVPVSLRILIRGSTIPSSNKRTFVMATRQW
jgi:hypothetical protein